MHKYLVFLIVFVSLALRLINLSSFPPSLNWDEVSIGYNAYSLLKTGRDEWGVALPTIFRAYGDYKLPGFIYADVLPVSFLGLSPMSVRLPSLAAGTLLVAVGYILASTLGLGRNGSLWAAALIAVSPWTWFLSRVGVEANLALLFVSVGITCLLRKKTASGILFLGLSAWTYNSARVFAPLFLLIYWWVNRKTIKYRHRTLLVFMIFFFPLGTQLFTQSGQARYKWLSLLDSGAVSTIEQLRMSSPLPSPLPRLLYNRPVYFVNKFLLNYIQHFHPDFLFLKGGTHYQFSIPHKGLFSPVLLPFFYVGLVAVLKNSFTTRSKYSICVLLWLLLAAIPGSLVRDAPHPLRAIFFVVPAILIIVMGAGKLFNSVKSIPALYFFQVMFGLLFSLSISRYVLSLPTYASTYAWSWQFGYSQVVEYTKKNYHLYDEIIFTKKYGEPHEFVLFHWPWDPSSYVSDPRLTRYFRSDWYWVDSFAKFRFVNDWEMSQITANLPAGQKYLIISSPDNSSPGTLLTQVNFPDNKPAFYINEL